MVTVFYIIIITIVNINITYLQMHVPSEEWNVYYV